MRKYKLLSGLLYESRSYRQIPGEPRQRETMRRLRPPAATAAMFRIDAIGLGLSRGDSGRAWQVLSASLFFTKCLLECPEKAPT